MVATGGWESFGKGGATYRAALHRGAVVTGAQGAGAAGALAG